MEQKDKQNTQEQFTVEQVSEAFTNLFNSSMCGDCIKNDVCKIKGTPESKCCKSFYNSMNWKRYGNIYAMFNPIFEWMKFHYPSGEVYFLVDSNSAKMLQEHKVYAFYESPFKRINPAVDSGGKSIHIVKHGSMQKMFKCKNCDCEFYTAEYAEDELNVGTLLNTEMKKVWIARCPECGCICDIEREEN